MDTLAVFRSRSDALKISRALTKEKIACATVSTPSSLKAGCGLSVVFPRTVIETVKKIILRENAASFVGFYPR